MKREQISDALNMLNHDIIEETDVVRSGKKKHRKSWVKWATIAASLILVIYAGTSLSTRELPDEKPELPLLTIDTETTDGMGFEGYMAYDISEIVNTNPWNEASEIATLPVYNNSVTYNEDGSTSGADFEKMREFLMEIADRCGLDTNTLTVKDDMPDDYITQKMREKLGDDFEGWNPQPTKLMVESDGLEIEVNQAMTCTISFDPAVSLPDKYNFTFYASYSDKATVAEYLKSEYKDLIGIENPKTNITGGDYNIYLQQEYSIEFFDASGNDVEQIMNYNFNRVSFCCDDDGKLFLARIYQPDFSQKVGDYPVITVEEAKKLLSKGNYITTVQYEMPGMEYVKKVELIYRSGEQEKCYMPYYRFYVELPEEEEDDGLKTYGAYYVPAVAAEYIANMPIWDGSLN